MPVSLLLESFGEVTHKLYGFEKIGNLLGFNPFE